MPDPQDRDPDDDDVDDGRAGRDPEPELDFDAEFSKLVADFGPTPAFERPTEEKPKSDEGLRRLLRQAWPDEETAAADDPEDHFEPPPPPPLPRPEPRRLLAWVAMLGAPIVALVLVVSPLPLPTSVGLGLFAAFVGGFGYLVWTMGSNRGEGWDDGARL